MTAETTVGTIQFSNGKCEICTDTKGTMEPFDAIFIAKNMRKTAATAKGYYGTYIRAMASDLTKFGTSSIPSVKTKINLIRGDKRQGVRNACGQWLAWLNQIDMLKNIKTTEGTNDGDANVVQ